jgi:hypothetical protein
MEGQADPQASLGVTPSHTTMSIKVCMLVICQDVTDWHHEEDMFAWFRALPCRSWIFRESISDCLAFAVLPQNPEAYFISPLRLGSKKSDLDSRNP